MQTTLAFSILLNNPVEDLYTRDANAKLAVSWTEAPAYVCEPCTCTAASKRVSNVPPISSQLPCFAPFTLQFAYVLALANTHAGTRAQSPGCSGSTRPCREHHPAQLITCISFYDSSTVLFPVYPSSIHGLLLHAWN